MPCSTAQTIEPGRQFTFKGLRDSFIQGNRTVSPIDHVSKPKQRMMDVQVPSFRLLAPQTGRRSGFVI